MSIHPSTTWLVLAAGVGDAGVNAVRPLVLLLSLALLACSPSSTSGGGGVRAEAVAGWYMEHAGTRTLLPCGGARSLAIADAGDLPGRARAFGLEDDLPVYVRVHAASRNGALVVVAVDQFGAPVPVRDCAMTGVVTQATPSPP